MKLNGFLLCLVFTMPLNAQSLKETADDLYAIGNYSKAIITYKSLKNLDNVYDDIAKAYIAIGNYEEGINNYKKAINANENNTLLKYEYAKLLTKTKKYNEANTLFSALVVLDSLNPNYHYGLGIVLEKQRDTLAFQRFNKTYDLDATHQKAIFKIAKRHLIKRNFIDAHGFIDRGLESYENNVELMSLKAQTYYHQHFYTHAVVWFNRLLSLGETSEFIHEKLSLSYAKNSDYEDAIYHRKEALKYNPNDANTIYVIGLYYEKLKNFEMAEEFISKALKIKDQSLSDEYQKLGAILNRQKKYEKSIKALQKSLKEDPNNLISEFGLLRAKDEFYADLDTKIKMYENYIEKRKKSPFVAYAQSRLKELKEEKFMQDD